MTTDSRPNLTELAETLGTTKSRVRAGRLGTLTDVYQRYLGDRRDEVRTVLEIGVESGGSVIMWARYFPNAHVYGADIRRIRIDTGPRTTVLKGSQSDPEFRDQIVRMTGALDLVVDDGSHEFVDQIATLLHIWPYIAPDGIYIVEDAHTSYREAYGGALRKPGTFIEWVKDAVDDVHVKEHKSDVVFEDLESISFHYQAVVLRKLGAMTRVQREADAAAG
jgi:cephalosporin hydroxylase